MLDPDSGYFRTIITFITQYHFIRYLAVISALAKFQPPLIITFPKP